MTAKGDFNCTQMETCTRSSVIVKNTWKKQYVVQIIIKTMIITNRNKYHFKQLLLVPESKEEDHYKKNISQILNSFSKQTFLTLAFTGSLHLLTISAQEKVTTKQFKRYVTSAGHFFRVLKIPKGPFVSYFKISFYDTGTS